MPYSFSVVTVLIMWIDESGWISGWKGYSYISWMNGKAEG